MNELRDEWIEMAEEEVLAATTLNPERNARAICFHCQQCIEFYLKGALLERGIDPPRIHALVALNDHLSRLESRFGELDDDLERLTPHAVLTRYGGPRPAPEKAREALRTMHQLRASIRSFMGLPDGLDVPTDNQPTASEGTPCPNCSPESQL